MTPSRLRPLRLALTYSAATLSLGAGAPALELIVANNGGGSGTHTLRWAIETANANAGHDTIDLRSISGTIVPHTPLPTITGPVTIIADGDVTLHGGGNHRLLDFETSLPGDSYSVVIEGVDFERGRGAAGGGVRAGWGGAIRAQGDIDLTVRSCVFRENTAELLGGAIVAYVPGLTLDACTFIDNRVDEDAIDTPDGGALGTGGTNATIRNCTFTGCRAPSGDGGVAIHYASGFINYVHCTFVDNHSATGGGAVHLAGGGADINNSAFFANSSGSGEVNTGAEPGAAFSLSGANWTSGDPLLGPLAVYKGGRIPTFNLAPGSPLLDAATGAATAATDARGKARPQNGAPDIGAFEAEVYTVTRTGPASDSGAGTLRSALNSGADYIVMPQPLLDGIWVQSALPPVEGIVIEGRGPLVPAIRPAADAPLLEVTSGAPVILSGLRVEPQADLDGGRTGIVCTGNTLWLRDCDFDELVSFEGGSALAVFEGELRAERCTFRRCESWIDGGGAVLVRDSKTLLENCTFFDNEARQGAGGGALALVGDVADPPHIDINHCTFYRNSAEGDGGHLLTAGDFSGPGLRNSILVAGSAGGSGALLWDPRGTLAQASNYGGSTAAGVLAADLSYPPGAVPVLPLLPGSPAVDSAVGGTGFLATDARGVARHREGPRADIGAYELVSHPYRRWTVDHFGAAAPAGSGPYEDPDGDGAKNVEEFLFAMNPRAADPHLLPRYSQNRVFFETYGGIAFRENHAAPGAVGYEVQLSTDGQSWGAGAMQRAPFSVIGPTHAEVAYHSPTAIGAPVLFGTGSEFYRVNVEPPATETLFCPVRDPGNPADTTGRGAVAEPFQIARYEVTNAEYATFLNTVDPDGNDPLDLYNAAMLTSPASGIQLTVNFPRGQKYAPVAGREHFPVVLVDYWDATRYANWLGNGASAISDTEDGAYTLLGGTPTPSNAGSIAGRNPGARVFLPDVDEWYKAAYYTGSGYSLYPTGGNTVNNSPPPGDGDSANFDGAGPTSVGVYLGTGNRYGAHDLGGNVDEFVEKAGAADSVLNIGGRFSAGEGLLRSTAWSAVASTTTASYTVTGFRVAARAE